MVTSVVDRAAVWLAAQLGADGRVGFSLDSKTRARESTGPLHHGRAAIVVRALVAHGGHPTMTALAASRLASDVSAALSGGAVESWPSDPVLRAATLALVSLAGIDVRAALLQAGNTKEVAQTTWYAAEVAAALGADAPEPIWTACVRGLELEPWAPWTAIAARVRGDAAVFARCEEGLVGSVRNYGAVFGSNGPDTARTAATVEALAPFASEAARAAAERAVGFLRRVQLAELGEPDHPDSIDGAFPVAPNDDVLRTDVTAQTVLALLAWERRERRPGDSSRPT